VINPPETFQTERLRLRKPVVDDAETIFHAYAQDAEVSKYLTWRPNRSIEETREFIGSCLAGWKERRSFHWVILRKAPEQLVGMVSARVEGPKLELGYVLARVHWNRGYMTEAVKAVIVWALDQPSIYRVWSVCDVENLASARVMEKAGMTKEGILRRWSVHPNMGAAPRDSYCYSATRQGA
jgi:ribosomal-protein-alanine N-acetyltransferase